MATSGEVAKLLKKMDVKTSEEVGIDKDATSSIWKPFEENNSQLRDVAKLIPSMYPFKINQWMTIVRGIFKDNPKLSNANKLRLTLKHAASNGLEIIRNKCGMMLRNLEKYGDDCSTMAEFWEWVKQTYHCARETRVRDFETYLREHKMGHIVNPLDAIDHVLYNYELDWEDVEHDEKLRNSVVYVLRRDKTYLAIEELFERNVRNWRRYLIQEWSKHAKVEYQKQYGTFPYWVTLPKQKNNQERRRRR